MTTNDSFAFFQKRYKDAYFLSRLTSVVGHLVQLAAVALAILIIGATLLMASKATLPDGSVSPVAVSIGAVGCISGIVLGALFCVLGLLISAQGQIILATLDTAVSCTPLLSNDEKRSILSRRKT